MSPKETTKTVSFVEVQPPPSPYTIDENQLIDRLYYHNYGRIHTQLYLGVINIISAISFGMALGWGVPISFVVEEELSNQAYWLISIVPLGCAFGALYVTYATKGSGPKRLILIQTVLYAICWAALFFGNDILSLAARFFLGFFGFTIQICLEKLARHTLHYRINKYVTEFNKAFQILGIIFADCLTDKLGPFWTTLICAGIPTLYFLMVLVLPESPVFCYATNVLRAQQNLAWYRGEANVQLDMLLIRRDYERSRQAEHYNYMLYSKAVLKAITIIVCLTVVETSTGYYVFLLYGIRFWNHNFVFTVFGDAVFVAMVFLTSRLFWGAFHARFYFRVRPMMLLSIFGVGAGLAALAAYYFWEEQQQYKQWVPLSFVVLLIFCYNMSLTYHTNMLTLAYTPFELIKTIVMVRNTLFWFCVFLNTLMYGVLYDYILNYVTFFLYTLIAFAGWIFVFFKVVEVKGASLVQIQLAMGANPVGSRGVSPRWLQESSPIADEVV